MFNLDFHKFTSVIKNNSNSKKLLIIPIYKEIVVDTETPVSVFLKLAQTEKYAYLLESAETSLHWGRYSFISFLPKILFSSSEDEVKIIQHGSTKKYKTDALQILKTLLNKYFIPEEVCKTLPRFLGGFVGYVDYELIHKIEPTVKKPNHNEFRTIPEMFFMFNSIVIIFDHYLNKLKLIYLVSVDKNINIKREYENACNTIDRIIKKIYTTVPVIKNLVFNNKYSEKDLHKGFKANISKEKYKSIVQKTKKYIFAGDIIQAVLSRRISKITTAEPFDIYRSLRIINPSPYMFYLKFDDMSLIGSSPEILVRKENKVVETRPIAGTRPRGKTEEEDNLLEQELKKSQKENAEHIMLVDLARNDLGRIAEFNSITLPELKIVEKFSHVMHIVSSVKGILKDEYDAIDVLKATFPAGTLSGAPKIRAMQIISELENTTRRTYGGAVGYFSLSGNMDMAITIRTILYKNKKVFIQTGAGIVADSNPESEYQETINKAKALMLAIKIAEEK